ncbi:glycosyl transferase, group 1 [Polaromonas naphthalenivorans CJ2]|uniref:Glycosyl transferase, group 1 n=2 Tax=Polaromonas naphthalenivorans TaxID=216465 RepID=A1VS48_POLNA|nr:glycosyl transferase, group 1 [Polaromonas naphthalenivorans CJ2]
MAAWLVARGHEVRVVTAPPYYPDWAVGAGYSARTWKRERWQGVDVWRCPLWVPTRPGGVKRLLHLASFALGSLPVMLRQIIWRPDVVWVVEPALFCAPAALVLARLSGAKAWLHVQDFEVDAAFDLGLLRGKFLRGVVAGTERWLMRHFDVVSTISQRMHQRLLDKGVVPAQAVLSPNWVDVLAITPGGHSFSAQAGMTAKAAGTTAEAADVTGLENSFRVKLGIAPDAVVALYSGNMGGKQGLELLADVAKLCLAQAAPAHTAIIFVFCGNGAGRDDLMRRCAGLPNVHFLELQPIERLNELLAMGDVHLLPQRADAADLVMPSKLTGMLASGRPVLATAHPGTELALVVQGCGVVVPPEDPSAMALAMQALAANSILRKQLGEAGRVYALAHLDREAVLRKFESALMAVTSKS